MSWVVKYNFTISIYNEFKSRAIVKKTLFKSHFPFSLFFMFFTIINNGLKIKIFLRKKNKVLIELQTY
jgi:hypothetical protein